MPVEGQDVRSDAHAGGPGYPPGVHVDGEQDVVDITGDEGEPGWAVEGQAVVVGAAGQRYAAGDRTGGRVDDHELVAALRVDQYVARGWVIGNVAGDSTQVDCP